MRYVSLIVCLFLVSCGYHLAGYGRGVMPTGVSILKVTGTGASTHAFLSEWRQYVSDHAQGYVVGEDNADAELRLGALSESFSAVSFDASGIGVTYQLLRSRSLSLWRKDVQIWSSGAIFVKGDVYAVGGPTSIEASKDRLRRDLDKRWMSEAWMKLSSGF